MLDERRPSNTVHHVVHLLVPQPAHLSASPSCLTHELLHQPLNPHQVKNDVFFHHLHLSFSPSSSSVTHFLHCCSLSTVYFTCPISVILPIFLSCLHQDGASAGGCSDDYAYPPPPVPAYSFPNSPALYRKGATGGHSRNIPTPGRSPSCSGVNLLRAHTAPSSPATRHSTRQQGVSTLPTPGRQHLCQTGSHDKCLEEPLSPLMIHYSTSPRHNGCQNQPKQTLNEQLQPRLGQHLRHPELTKQRSVDELRSTVQTVASSIEHGTQDVRHLGQKMKAATEMITDSVEENAQALNLLAEVVDKLQGLIVASKHPESSPPRRPKQHTPPPPPPRVSSISPKVVRKPPTPYPHHVSSSSSSCSSSSSTSVSSCADGFAISLSPKQTNGASKKTVVSFGATQRASGCGSNGQVRLNNGSVSRASLEDQQDSTGCLTTRKKKK